MRKIVGLINLASSSRCKLGKEGKFPKRIKIGATAYRLSEVQAWIRGEWLI